MTFSELDEFKIDFKKLIKKYRSLNDDLEIVKKVLTVEPGARPPFSFRISGLGINTCVIKVKKMACKSLKGRGVNTGLRLIYAHFENDNEIVFVELYHKGNKEQEDRRRILKHFK
jgi:mRNA-degrading endonuclease YafQ of YafQ-DinJ toxin-antitoxin module